MKFLFNALIVCLLIQFSGCIKEEPETPALSPGLSDFKIDAKRLGEAPFLLDNPKSKSDGAFVFKASDPSLVKIDGNTVALLKGGTCTIIAIQSASEGFKADSIKATFVIAPRNYPIMTDFTIPEKKLGDAPFELVGPKSNSKGTISYISSNPEVASIAGNLVTIKAVGKTTIRANQIESGIYSAGSLSIDLVIIDPPIIKNTVTDIDGNVYKTVKIGTQTWMMENLKTTRYRDGSIVPNVTDQSIWGGSKGAYCNYSNDPANGNVYGKLYNWYAVVDPGKLAPQGWHIPSDAEWTVLYNYIGGTRYDGGKIQEQGTSHWINNTGATNTTLFTGLGGGSRSYLGIFGEMGYDAIWWSTTESQNKVWCYDLYVKGYLERIEEHKGSGFSVRCIKD